MKKFQAKELFKDFLESEKSGGLILIFCTLISLIITSSYIGISYQEFWHLNIAGESIEYWINDGLMTIFFLLIGLELEREIYIGELSKIKDALFPIFGAIGGMFIPAGIYLYFNYGTSSQVGVGVPMATDIAFALGILSLLGDRVPASLKVFLTALATIDDLGAILIIAIFYSSTLFWSYLLIAAAIFCGLLLLNRFNVNNISLYLIGGIAMWYFMLNSGVHATITGILLAFAIPFREDDEASPSYTIQHHLHKPVAFIILPLFALANTAIAINGNLGEVFTYNYSIGILLGLVLGKPIGIFLFTFLVDKTGISKLPSDLNWSVIISTGFLGGIGFTMAIFITLLAFDEITIINNTKLVVLISSFLAALIGYIGLKLFLKKKAFTEKSMNLSGE